MKRTFVIGSRGSQLALWQAHHIAGRLAEHGVETRIEIIRTTGDRLQSASLTKAGGKGLFTKEIEDALLTGAVDIAVHSLKDLPTADTEGLTIAAVPEREDPRDALTGCKPYELRKQARVGTSSSRRATQLLLLNPDLMVGAVRGNVDTRLRKLDEGQFDALVLAAAGLRRLGLSSRIDYLFGPDEICPAPGQGALAIQTRRDDEALRCCQLLNHLPSATAVRCERTLLATLGSGCELPVGAYASLDGPRLHLTAFVSAPDAREHLRLELEGEAGDPVALGTQGAARLIARGARDMLAVRHG